MYRDYFGLDKLPFKVTPDPNFFFSHASRDDILNALYSSIERGDPIIKVVADVGCGKTTLLRLLLKRLQESPHYAVISINSPNLSAKDMLFAICQSLSLELDPSLHKFQVFHALSERLLQLHSDGKQAVILIDEAQSMLPDTLEEVRLLTNLETDSDKLLQIVLFGQPELEVTLDSPHLRQLKSRIAYDVILEPLTPSDVKEYVNYRMRCAGYQGEDVFDQSSARLIHKLTGGLPREINLLADKLLMSAFGHKDKKIKRHHFIDVVPDRVHSFKVLTWVVLLLLLLIILGLAYQFKILPDGWQESESLPAPKSVPSEKLNSRAHENQIQKIKKVSTQGDSQSTQITLSVKTNDSKQNNKTPDLKDKSLVVHDASKNDWAVSVIQHSYLLSSLQEASSFEAKKSPTSKPVSKRTHQPSPLNKKRFQQFLIAQGMSLSESKQVMLWYQQSLQRIWPLLSAQYSIQLYSGQVGRAGQAYRQILQHLTPEQRQRTYLIFDLSVPKVVVLYDYDTLATPLREEIKQLPDFFQQLKAFVIPVSSIQEMLIKTKDYL